MISKDISKKTLVSEITADNDEFYRHIFKKTEKIVCAVFFILRNGQYDVSDSIIKDIEKSAQDVLNKVHATLETTERTRIKTSRAFRFTLMRLESELRLAHAAHLLEQGYLEVFLHEIDSVQRVLKKYTDDNVVSPIVETETSYQALPSVRQRAVRERGIPGFTPHDVNNVMRVSTEGTLQKSRRDRVLDVIKDKGSAMIKDITDHIKDCSEKTIQRELISLINDGVIVREGERRWSKYKLV